MDSNKGAGMFASMDSNKRKCKVMIILMSFIDVLFGCYYFMLYLCIHVKDVII